MNVITGKMSAAWMVQTAVAMHGTYVGYKTSALSPGDTCNWTCDLGQTTNSSFEMLRAAEWVRQSQLVLIRQNRVLRRASKGRLRWSEQFEPRWWLERREAGRAKPAEEETRPSWGELYPGNAWGSRLGGTGVLTVSLDVPFALFTLEHIIGTESLGIQDAVALSQKRRVKCGDVWNLSQDANSETMEKEVDSVCGVFKCAFISP